jgi:MSHA biogenesis protein MshP
MNRRIRQRGMSLVVAIFLIVIIASLAAFAVTVGTATRESTNLQLLADRAQAAAHAGTEWAAYRARVNGVCTNQVLNLTQGALRGFRVTVTCGVPTPLHTEGALTYNVFDVTSRAQLGNFGAANYTSRTIEARFTTAP